MGTFWLVLGVVFILYGIPQSVRTFRREMEIDANVWLMAVCGGIAAFYYITTHLL
jgi:hypothetical protein